MALRKYLCTLLSASRHSGDEAGRMFSLCDESTDALEGGIVVLDGRAEVIGDGVGEVATEVVVPSAARSISSLQVSPEKEEAYDTSRLPR